ncbi:MAG: HDOD domain-containing protein [Syntrophomonadaceae bacterium]|jgi:putative nucleotidyltransferase with HDIG domain|nr:HDOD domain-containing protein [Syntrophomonadaceae bacterium]
MPKLTLPEVIEKVNEIPALPNVVVRVMQLTEDPESTVKDIHNVLSQDQAMTARVLRLANSAFYGFARRIGSVTEAVILLGFKTIRSIVLAAAVSDIMNHSMKGYSLEKGDLWLHSQAVAMAARTISRRVKYDNPDLAFTAGLLHDIGKIALDQSMQEVYQEVIDTVASENITFSEAEDMVLGFNHSVVGGKIAAKWKLPDNLVEAIEFHHSPENAEIDSVLVAIVHISDAVCVSMGIGLGIDGLLYKIYPEALERLNLDDLKIEEIMAELSDLFADL